MENNLESVHTRDFNSQPWQSVACRLPTELKSPVFNRQRKISEVRAGG